MVWPPPCTKGKNKAHSILVGSLIVKMAGNGMGEAHQRPTCEWGRPGAIHIVTRPGAWPLQGIPYEGLQRGLRGSLRASQYLSKNTGVVDGSLHITTLLFSFRIYIVILVVCFTFPSLVGRIGM